MTAERRNLWLLAGAWLFVSIAMTLLSWSHISQREFPDPDDVMRLIQVRDWMAGQSWFDVTQYRLNLPYGVPMHWSRIVDVPIAAVILVSRPFLGPTGAETAALIIVPLVTLGLAMFLVYRIAAKLMDGNAALAAAIATPLSLGGMKQMRPMRIDHHGWQISMALVALLAALDTRPRRSGIIVGIAIATWMNISLEGLPFAAAFGALFAWQWLSRPAATERLKSYLGALAVSSLFLFVLTHAPSTWASQQRDVVTPAHLAAFAVAWIACTFAVRESVVRPEMRIIRLGAAGFLTIATMFAVDPHWLVGPFGSLDPLVKQMWYLTVNEGLPMWQVSASEAATGIAQPLVGLIGAAVALSRTSDAERKLWATYTFILASVTLAGVFVLRAETTASVVALPGTAFLCGLALVRARKVSLMPARVVASTAAVCIMAPAYAVPLSVTPADNRFAAAADAFKDCGSKSEVDKLRLLPTGDIAAPLDITPAILEETSHRAIASGHHRNESGMHDVIELFLSPPSQGAEIVARRHSDYLVFCPGAPEALRSAYRRPNGLAAMLIAGTAPDWLERVDVPGLHGLQVWRVRKAVAAAEARG